MIGMNERVDTDGRICGAGGPPARATCGAGILPARNCGAGGSPARGVTMIELIVVIGIIAFVAMSFISGLIRYQSRYKANAALNMVDSALHYARNLAIANNAVYHIRFENVFETNPADTTLTAPASRTPLDAQSVGIYCFPVMSQAMAVTEESQTKWNPSKRLVSPAGITYSNYLVDRTVLPQGAYCGFHYTGAVSSPYDSVLYFMPDGTMYFSANGSVRTGAMIFVTDNPDYADNRSLAAPDYSLLQENRRLFFNTHTPPVTSSKMKGKPVGIVRMLTIYIGGLIKTMPAGSSL